MSTSRFLKTVAAVLLGAATLLSTPVLHAESKTLLNVSYDPPRAP
jgi:ABC-type sulfate transport system substrate-binding protein